VDFSSGALHDSITQTALILLGVLFLGAIVLFVQERRQANQPRAAEVMASDPRRPVLYLRPFKEDARTFHVGFGRKADDVRAEPLILEPFNILGPLVAIGRPEEDMPPWAGAARFYVAGDDWHSDFLGLLDRAQLVVLFAGTTENLRWELAQVFHREPFVPAVLLLPFFGQELKSFQASFTAATDVELPENLNRVRLIYFPAPDQPVPFADTKDEVDRLLTVDNPYLAALTRVVDLIQPGSAAPWIEKAYGNYWAKYIGIAIGIAITLLIFIGNALWGR
jgi:hypothetical protein